MQLPSSRIKGRKPGSNVRLGGILSRLAKDKRGNVMMIAGASAIPLMMMAGAAIDYSRAVIVRSQMQDACDTTALTLRKRISANQNQMSPTMKADAERYFEGVLGDSVQGAKKASVNASWVQQSGRSVAKINATYTMSGSLLKVVTNKNLEISVDCEAEHNLLNYDILFLLDVTGSMNCLPNETCPSGVTTGRKIDILKNVVNNFIADMTPTQAEMRRNNRRLRYAVLPYSNGVNMRDMFTGNISRYFYITNSKTINGSNVPGTYSLFNFSDAEMPNAPNDRLESWDLPGAPDTPAPNWNGCIVERQTSTVTEPSNLATALDMDIDLVPVPGRPETFWQPYIPENTRDSAGNLLNLTSYCPPPAMGFREITPDAGGAGTISRDNFNAYINSLTAVGGTMTDVGMNWAARMISPNGIFADSPNIDPNNGVEVQKVVILITDGYIAPPPFVYTAYGYMGTPGNTNGVLRVINGPLAWNTPGPSSHDPNWRDQAYTRLGLTCRTLIQRNTSIWVIGFGTGMANIASNNALAGCANPSDQIADAATQTGLTNIMNRIAGRIGGLRIVK